MDQRTYEIIGAAMLLHRELGPGYLEVTYQTGLAIEFRHRGIPFEREVPIEVWFRGERLGGAYRADFQCYGDILVELKALPQLGRNEVSPLAHYLTATGRPMGLLVNFGADSLQFQRVLPRRSTLTGPTRRESARSLARAEEILAGGQADWPASAQSQEPLGFVAGPSVNP